MLRCFGSAWHAFRQRVVRPCTDAEALQRERRDAELDVVRQRVDAANRKLELVECKLLAPRAHLQELARRWKTLSAEQQGERGVRTEFASAHKRLADKVRMLEGLRTALCESVARNERILSDDADIVRLIGEMNDDYERLGTRDDETAHAILQSRVTVFQNSETGSMYKDASDALDDVVREAAGPVERDELTRLFEDILTTGASAQPLFPQALDTGAAFAAQASAVLLPAPAANDALVVSAAGTAAGSGGVRAQPVPARTLADISRACALAI